MKWRVWFMPKHYAIAACSSVGRSQADALADARAEHSEVIEADRAFVDPYSKVLSFLPQSVIADSPADSDGSRRRKPGRPKRAPVHALRGIQADVWKEYEQEPE